MKFVLFFSAISMITELSNILLNFSNEIKQRLELFSGLVIKSQFIWISYSTETRLINLFKYLFIDRFGFRFFIKLPYSDI